MDGFPIKWTWKSKSIKNMFKEPFVGLCFITVWSTPGSTGVESSQVSPRHWMLEGSRIHQTMQFQLMFDLATVERYMSNKDKNILWNPVSFVRISKVYRCYTPLTFVEFYLLSNTNNFTAHMYVALCSHMITDWVESAKEISLQQYNSRGAGGDRVMWKNKSLLPSLSICLCYKHPPQQPKNGWKTAGT